MSNEDLDLRQLSQRGWTRRMIDTLLRREDYRVPVNHFRNFSGKMMFARWRVESVEATDAFRKMFWAYARHQGLSKGFVEEVLARSRALDAAGAQWKGPPPLSDSERAAAAFATALRLIRMRGYRTPHKC
jgi:hypothetical protein